MAKLLAFLWKDWEQARSYRLSFSLQAVTLFLPLVGLYFMGRLFHRVEVPDLDRYGGNYAAFALVGVVVTSYSGTALRAFSTSLRTAQFTGTLEALLLTRASVATMVFGWSLYPFLRATLTMLVYLAGGFLVLGSGLDDADPATVLVTLVLTVIVMGSLGILAASFTLVFKQGDPFTGALVLASGMLSGTLYPVSVLPGWLQVVALLLPYTHAIEAMRLAALRGLSPLELAPQLGPLALYAALLVPLAAWTFSLALRRARVEGSLAHY